MIPVKINTWGRFIDRQGKTGRLIVENLTDKFDFRLYTYYDTSSVPFDEWLQKIGYVEFALMQYFTSVIWESNTTTNAPLPDFLPDEQGLIISSKKYANCSIIFLATHTNKDTQLTYNIPNDTPAWLVSITDSDHEEIYSDVLIQPSAVAYFFEQYDLQIEYPNRFDLETDDGLLSAIAYWGLYAQHYPNAKDKLTHLIKVFWKKLAHASILLDAHNAKIMLAAWENQPNSSEKEAAITFFQNMVANYTITEPMTNKIKSLEARRAARPLLAREALELDTLQNILAAPDLPTIDKILENLHQTPTDAELRARLIGHAESKRKLLASQ